MFSHPKIKEEIRFVFPYGSKVYGTHTEKSDEDYIIIVRSDDDVDYGIHEGNINIFVHSDILFQNMIHEHKVQALECYFSHDNDFEFSLDKVKLRNSFSAVASNSFSKCRKKLKPGANFDPYIAKKSLFHALRIIDFGIQIAKYGKIVNFSSCNAYFDEIMRIPSDDFNVFWDRFESVGQALKSEFKKVAPLEKDKIERKW